MLNVNIKDSDWPPMTNWVTQDLCGMVKFWKCKPSPENGCWIGGDVFKYMPVDKRNKNWQQAIIERPESTETRKHSHYFKDVSSIQKIDVYRILDLYEVTDPCVQHAVKKLLVAGKRGAKDQAKDIQEAIDTLTRWQDMQGENNG